MSPIERARDELMITAKNHGVGDAVESDVAAAALRYAAAIVDAMPDEQVTTFGLAAQMLRVAAMGEELPKVTP